MKKASRPVDERAWTPAVGKITTPSGPFNSSRGHRFLDKEGRWDRKEFGGIAADGDRSVPAPAGLRIVHIIHSFHIVPIVHIIHFIPIVPSFRITV